MPPGIYDLFSLAMTNSPLRHDRATYVDVAQSSEAKGEQFMIHRSRAQSDIVHRYCSVTPQCQQECRFPLWRPLPLRPKTPPARSLWRPARHQS